MQRNKSTSLPILGNRKQFDEPSSFLRKETKEKVHLSFKTKQSCQWLGVLGIFDKRLQQLGERLLNRCQQYFLGAKPSFFFFVKLIKPGFRGYTGPVPTSMPVVVLLECESWKNWNRGSKVAGPKRANSSDSQNPKTYSRRSPRSFSSGRRLGGYLRLRWEKSMLNSGCFMNSSVLKKKKGRKISASNFVIWGVCMLAVLTDMRLSNREAERFRYH